MRWRCAIAAGSAVVEAIAAAEKSLVAIAGSQDRTAENTPLEFGRPLGGMAAATPAVRPIRTSFPTTIATGVIIDRQGLILTAYHAWAEDAITTSPPPSGRSIAPWIKGADPRSDLAVLAIEAGGPAADRLGRCRPGSRRARS